MEAIVDFRLQIPPTDHIVPKHNCTVLSSFEPGGSLPQCSSVRAVTYQGLSTLIKAFPKDS